jgi:hypothetical protein
MAQSLEADYASNSYLFVPRGTRHDDPNYRPARLGPPDPSQGRIGARRAFGIRYLRGLWAVVRAAIELFGLVQVARWAGRALGVGEHIEFIARHAREVVEGAGDMIEYLLDPPPLLGLGFVAVAVLLIWLDLRRIKRRAIVNVPAPASALAQGEVESRREAESRPSRGRVTPPLDMPVSAPKIAEAPKPLVPATRYQYIDRILTHFYVEPPNVDLPKGVTRWHVCIHPKKSVSNVTIRLDFTHHTGGINGYWVLEESLLAKRLDFTAKSAEHILIAESEVREGRRFWNWAFGRKGAMSYTTPMYRACLSFLVGDDKIDEFDFVIYSWHPEDDLNHKEVDLIFIGEDRFDFSSDWPKNPAY